MIINILGKGDGYKDIEKIINLPVEERGEIWGVNDAFVRHKCEKTFHMHDLNVWQDREESVSSTKLCIEHAKNYPDMEFFTIKKYEKIPNAKEYPLDEIVKYFGTNYFTNGISYMIAYALYKGVTQLNLYGVNMTHQTEYIAQKPNVEYWLGRAQGAGVKVNFQWQYTSLLKSKDGQVYGYFFDQYRIDY